jgi:phosphatidylglycerophosphate synthase
MNDKDLKKLFTSHKVEISDEGFSERVVQRLPQRTNILSQIIMITFIFIGFVLVFVLQGFAPILEQINQLGISIRQMEFSSIMAIVGSLIIWTFLLGTVGFSVASVSD